MEAISSIENSMICAEETAVLHDDLTLVQACKGGDVAAFEQLVERHSARVFAIVQSIACNREDTEDVVQEAFLSAYRNMNQFREDSRFSTWLIRIAINRALLKLQKRRSAKEVSIDEDFGSDEIAPLEFAHWAPNPEELYRGDELRGILSSALQKLRPGLRIVFVLRDIQGLSTEETANVLALTAGAVKTRLLRARLLLRERLSKYFVVQNRDRS